MNICPAYNDFVYEYAGLLERWKSNSSVTISSTESKSTLSENNPKVIIFPPHPDDECLTGAFPLRLQRELGFDITVIPVTLGSNRDQRHRRLKELYSACGYLGFRVVLPKKGEGLENINLRTRDENPEEWVGYVDIISEILDQQQPSSIFVPSLNDIHPTHIGTHCLVFDALESLESRGSGLQCYVIETVYWGTMVQPNLLLESNIEDVADLVTAISLHEGETKRTPYHLTFPAWLTDNVRRGAEVVGGMGSECPNFLFGTVYRVMRWVDGIMEDAYEGGKSISIHDNLADLIPVEETVAMTV